MFGRSAITVAKRDENWSLEHTGNWEFFRRDLDGDLDYTDANELKDRRAHNVVNELLTRNTNDSGGVEHTLTYDLDGNMNDDGQRYTYKYDAFGRLKEVRNRSNAALIAEYKYNGLGYRIGWHYDTDTDGTVESSTDDPWYLFVYDDRWRIVNTYRLLDWAYNASNPVASYAKERFVYHNAGLGGWGGSSYIDSVMLRDRDADTAWNAASDGTMEERVYHCQNWRHDVSALITDDGRMIEWVKYSSYGVPWSLPAADTDSDGDYDATDSAAITGTYDVRKDVTLDGAVDVLDFLDALDLNNGFVTLGWSKLGATKWGNRKGYAGYEGDTALAGTKWHVRHRVLESELGRWMRRDPAGYVETASLIQYATLNPIDRIDSYGLASIDGFFQPCICMPNNCLCDSDPGGSPNDIISDSTNGNDEGTSNTECARCWKEAANDPEIKGMLDFMKISCNFRLRVICTRTHPDCQSEGAGGFHDPATDNIFICANKLNCSKVKMILRHELSHAYLGCLGYHDPTCKTRVCNEMRAYKFDGGCNVPEPDGRLEAGQTPDQCNRYWIWWSLGQAGCNETQAEVNAMIDELAGDPICGW